MVNVWPEDDIRRYIQVSRHLEDVSKDHLALKHDGDYVMFKVNDPDIAITLFRWSRWRKNRQSYNSPETKTKVIGTGQKHEYTLKEGSGTDRNTHYYLRKIENAATGEQVYIEPPEIELGVIEGDSAEDKTFSSGIILVAAVVGIIIFLIIIMGRKKGGG